MSYKRNRAGKSTREMAQNRRQSALWIGFAGIVVVIVLGMLLQNSKALGFGGAGVLVLLILLRVVPGMIEGQVDRKLKEEKRAVRGAKAEEKIGEILLDLPENYYLLNDVESLYGNIDHVVISEESGIFLIETKAHGGRVEVKDEKLLVNGKSPEKDYIAQTLRNTYWLRDEISQIVGCEKPWITSIVVFTNAFVVPTRPIKGIHIVNRKYLLNVIYKSKRANASNTQIWLRREEIGDSLL